MTHINDGSGIALCKSPDGPIVTGGLHADCTACRELRMIPPVKERGCEPRPEPSWTPEPMAGAETMVEEAKKKREGC